MIEYLKERLDKTEQTQLEMKADIQSLRELVESLAQTIARTWDSLATKEDLKAFATKDDLKAFVTKDDFEKLTAKFATKDDLQAFGARFATKDDFKELKTELREEIIEASFGLQVQINDLSTDLRSFKQDTQANFDKVTDKIDDLYDTVMNHDGRIEKLETKVFA